MGKYVSDVPAVENLYDVGLYDKIINYSIYSSSTTPTSLTTALEITGKGYIDAISFAIRYSNLTVLCRLVVTVDGVVLYDTGAVSMANGSYARSFFNGNILSSSWYGTLTYIYGRLGEAVALDGDNGSVGSLVYSTIRYGGITSHNNTISSAFSTLASNTTDSTKGVVFDKPILFNKSFKVQYYGPGNSSSALQLQVKGGYK